MSKKWRPGIVYEVSATVIIEKHIYTENSLIVNGGDIQVFRTKGKEGTRAEAELALRKIKAILKSGEIK